MTKSLLTRSTAVLLCSSALLHSASAPLHAQSTKAGVDLSLSAEAASNPILNDTNTDLAPAGTVEVRPWIRTETGTTTFDLEAFANLREFVSDYDSEDRYGGFASVASRVSERVTLRANAGVFSSNGRLGSLAQTGVPVVQNPGGPSIPIDPALGNDITVLGQDGRTTSWNVGAGLDAQVSERDTITFGAGFQDLSLSDSLQGEEYKSYSGDIGWQHRLNERTSVGLFGGIRETNFDDELSGDTTTYSGGVSLNQAIGSEGSLELGVGVAQTEIDGTPLVPARDVTTLTTQAALCQRNNRRDLCLNYRRTPLPTAFGGVRNSDSLGVSLSERLSDRDRLTVGGNYARTSDGVTGPLLIPQVEFADVRAAINRRFNDRLDGFIFAGASRLYRDDLATDASVNFGLGIRVRLGDRR
ncbi:hypothetical protein ACRAQ7_08730 [Erythrobacter sp. W53]|uniref:hypothetical protein n=1 Tax=Erythrobacter sp. W53 TaxID=3425947 RepID=UPI003D766A13